MATEVTIRFDTGNAAFDDGNGPTESARILRRIAARLEAGIEDGVISDSNGNRIGEWCAEFREEEEEESEDLTPAAVPATRGDSIRRLGLQRGFTTMEKTIRIGTVTDGDMFAKISFNNGRLSISGVIGPRRNGDCKGSCGQFIMSFKEYDHRGHATLDSIKPAPGWDAGTIRRFFDTWDRWHLNDMTAGSPAQEEFLRAHPIVAVYPESHYDKACAALAAAGLHPDADGYKYGSAWKFEAVPDEVIAFLQSLPDTDKTPAWV